MLRIAEEALTFDDVLLLPAHSTVLPRAVSLETRITRSIGLNIPLISAAMDTVTEARLAIAMAQEGGFGVIHKSMSIEKQAREVRIVKKFESGVVKDPITIPVTATVRDLIALMKENDISGMPVLDGTGLVGIVTISLIVIVVVLTSVLRAEQVRLRGTEDSTLMAIAPDGVLLEPSFVRVLGGRLMRANRRAELFAVLVVKIDALSRISTAFGADEAEHVRQAARAAVRRLSPTTAAMGTDDEGKLLLAFQPKSPAEARQLAARMHRAMLDQLRTAGVPVIPPIGMGLSVTSTSGYDRETLLDAARAAARRAIASDDVTVVVAGEDDDADSSARGDQAVRR